MSDEARELANAILGEVEEDGSKPHDRHYRGLYIDEAATMIDAAFAKVREKCAHRARKAIMDEWHDYKSVKIMIPFDIRDAVAESVYAAMLGKDK